MGETKDEAYEEELLDYEEEDDKAPDSAGAKVNGEATKKYVHDVLLCQDIINLRFCNVTNFFLFLSCRGYVGIHSSGFRDFLLKPELLRAIVDSGFEHPSEGKLSIYLNLLFNLQLLLLAVVAVCDDFEDFRFVMVIVIIVLKYLLGFFICSEIVWRPLFSVTKAI